MYSCTYLEPVYCSMSSSNCCFLTCIRISQEAGQVVCYSHIFQNFPQFSVIHTVKGFGIVNKAEIDVFSRTLFFDDPADVGNLISGSSAFLSVLLLCLLHLQSSSCKSETALEENFFFCHGAVFRMLLSYSFSLRGHYDQIICFLAEIQTIVSFWAHPWFSEQLGLGSGCPFALVQAQGATGLMCARSNPWLQRTLSVSFLFSLLSSLRFQLAFSDHQTSIQSWKCNLKTLTLWKCTLRSQQIGEKGRFFFWAMVKDSALRNATCNQEFVNKAYNEVKLHQAGKPDCGSHDNLTQAKVK